MNTKYLHTRFNALKVISIIILVALLSFGLFSCTDNSSVELHAEMVGRWSYSFPPGLEAVPDFDYDTEGGLIDAIAIARADIDSKEYLLLSFDAASGRLNSRVFIFDTEDPVSPRLVSSIAPEKRELESYHVRDITVQDGILYASLFLDKGLWMVDISDPTAPKDLGIAPVEITSNIIVSGDYAYASGQRYDGVTICDISDVENVREIARIDLSTREHCLAVSGDHLFVGIGRTLTVYDISTPSSPKQVGACELAVSEGLVTELPFYQPGEIHWTNWASIINLQASGDYVYVTFGAGQLRVIDVSDPAAPKETTDADLGGFAIALTLKDDYLYMTKSDVESQKLQLVIMDVSEPGNPKVIDSVATESDFGFGGASFAYCWARPQVTNDYIYIAGINYLDVFKLR